MQAKLFIVSPEVKPNEFKLTLPTTIGRSRDAKLKLVHPLVSRLHCELFEQDGVLMVRDLGSLNGTFVAGDRVTESAVQSGELLTIGSVTFRAAYGEEVELAPPKARKGKSGARAVTDTQADPLRETVSSPRAADAEEDLPWLAGTADAAGDESLAGVGDEAVEQAEELVEFASLDTEDEGDLVEPIDDIVEPIEELEIVEPMTEESTPAQELEVDTVEPLAVEDAPAEIDMDWLTGPEVAHAASTEPAESDAIIAFDDELGAAPAGAAPVEIKANSVAPASTADSGGIDFVMETPESDEDDTAVVMESELAELLGDDPAAAAPAPKSSPAAKGATPRSPDPHKADRSKAAQPSSPAKMPAKSPKLAPDPAKSQPGTVAKPANKTPKTPPPKSKQAAENKPSSPPEQDPWAGLDADSPTPSGDQTAATTDDENWDNFLEGLK